MLVCDFLNDELSSFAKYSCYRGLPSAIDGLKNSGRKIVYVAQTDLKRETKVSVFSGIVQVNTEYLHGDISGSVVKLARDYTGSNNIPILIPEGNFGTRMMPKASANRYIFVSKPSYFDKLFSPQDSNILISQEFEGSKIEPRFFTPTLPLVFLNYTKSLATGFSGEILPRDPKNIIKLLKKYLKEDKLDKKLMKVFFRGFKGEISQEENKVLIKGKFTRDKYNTIIVEEIPIGFDLQSYKSHLDSLEEKKKIKSYEDHSEDDNFKFIIKLEKSVFEESDASLEKLLKLTKTFTENYTCLDEDNNIVSFNSDIELLEYYIKIKLKYLEFRRQYIIDNKVVDLKELYSEFLFIKMVLDNIIDLRKMYKTEIVELLKENNKIVTKNDSYDYLLRIAIVNFTPEKLQELKDKIKDLKETIDTLNSKSNKDIWLEELESLETLSAFK